MSETTCYVADDDGCPHCGAPSADAGAPKAPDAIPGRLGNRFSRAAARIRAQAGAPKRGEALCRCDAGVCLLHPSLNTCGMRDRAPAEPVPPVPLTTRELECPCCGDVGARADIDGYFHDGDRLVCGCPGWVSADEDDVSITQGDEPCEKCDPPVPPVRETAKALLDAYFCAARSGQVEDCIRIGHVIQSRCVIHVRETPAVETTPEAQEMAARIRAFLADDGASIWDSCQLLVDAAAILSPLPSPAGNEGEERES